MDSTAGMVGMPGPIGSMAPPLNGNTDFSQMLAGWQMPPSMNPLPQAELDPNTMLAGWKLPPGIGEPIRAESPVVDLPTPTPAGPILEKSPDVWLKPQGPDLPPPSPANDMLLSGGPLMVHDGRLSSIPNGWERSGRISIDGDSVTQDFGRGHKAEYSLSQLSEHARDPAYFTDTMIYAAQRGDAVTISFHDGASHVKDPTLEKLLPRDFPYTDAILHASVKYQINPALLAAVGEQESGMGKGAYYNQVTHIGGDGHGHGMWQMDDRYHSMADSLRAGRDPYFAADKAAQQLSGAIARDGYEAGIQSYNGSDPNLPYYNLVQGRLDAINREVSHERSPSLGR